MSCGGSMLRTSHQPLAHLVDGAAEKWLAVAQASSAEQQRVAADIIRAFPLGERPELTYHGLRFLLSIYQESSTQVAGVQSEPRIKVHRIAQPG